MPALRKAPLDVDTLLGDSKASADLPAQEFSSAERKASGIDDVPSSVKQQQNF